MEGVSMSPTSLRRKDFVTLLLALMVCGCAPSYSEVPPDQNVGQAEGCPKSCPACAAPAYSVPAPCANCAVQAYQPPPVITPAGAPALPCAVAAPPVPGTVYFPPPPPPSTPPLPPIA